MFGHNCEECERLRKASGKGHGVGDFIVSAAVAVGMIGVVIWGFTAGGFLGGALAIGGCIVAVTGFGDLGS